MTLLEKEGLIKLLEYPTVKTKMILAKDIIVKYDEDLRNTKLGCLCTQTSRNRVLEAGIKLLEIS